MNQTAQVECAHPGLHVVKDRKSNRQEETLLEGVDVRLQELGNLITDLGDAAYPSLAARSNGMRETWEELAVKEATLRWIVRVAKHSDGRVRERLLLDVEKALDDLEHTADSIVHRECT
jgi:hypothetical protein